MNSESQADSHSLPAGNALIAAVAESLESPRLVRRLEMLCRAAATESEAHYAALFVIDESGRRVRIRGVCATPPFERTAPRVEVSRGEATILWEAIATGRGVAAPSAAERGPKAIEERSACETTLALPVQIGPTPLGALLLGKDSGEFSEDQMIAAAEITAVAGACIAEASGPGTAAASGTLADELRALQADFIASVTHELRTPLTSIVGLAKSLEEEAPGENTERLNTQAKRLLTLIEDLLTSQRLDGRRSELPVEAIDLAEIASEVATQWSDSVVCSIDAHAPWPATLGHRGALRTILRHLFSNAARFAPGAPVRILAESGSDSCRLIFDDAGPGIDQAEREKVFERFYRIGGSSSRYTSGTGIGLFLVRRLAEEMGGDAHIEEAASGGTAVVITLKLAAD